jgi:hypothetical protein
MLHLSDDRHKRGRAFGLTISFSLLLAMVAERTVCHDLCIATRPLAVTRNSRRVRVMTGHARAACAVHPRGHGRRRLARLIRERAPARLASVV